MKSKKCSWFSNFPKIQAPPKWGIEPVPASQRVLGFWDYFILWGDLGVGLLVLLTGSFLAPGLGLVDAALAITVGSLIGSGLLAVIGWIGSRNGVPTMVLLRPVLGLRGSYLPSVINVIQLIGWTIFEFVIMGFAADAISKNLLGYSNIALWTGIFACIVILMGLGGPIGVVREWLKKFAVWVVLATTVWLTWHLFNSNEISRLLLKPGDGSFPFWAAVDLVISMPVSWLPLVADYNRFARKPGAAFWGTFSGYAITNIWFYLLGVIILMTAGVVQEPKEFVHAVVLTAGWAAFLVLLLDETDNAWADLYSSSVSLQNVFPKVNQTWLILGLGFCSFLAAVLVDITQYESFLLLTGSLLIPLFGATAADYFIVHKQKYESWDLYQNNDKKALAAGINPFGMTAWIAGVIAFQVTNPATLGGFIPSWPAMVPTQLTGWGGSIPGFLVSFAFYLLLVYTFKPKSPVQNMEKEVLQ